MDRTSRPAPGRRFAEGTGLIASLGVAALILLLSASPAAAQSACGAGYTVRSGDSLLEIAQQCGITLPALLAANPGVRDQMDLQVGDRLRIPSPDEPQPSPVEACGPYYTIRAGDTPAEIAEKCGLTVPLLMAANAPLPDPLGLNAGERIRIPDLPERVVRDPATLALPPAVVADTAQDPAEADSQAAQADDEREMVRVEGTLQAGESCLLVDTADRGSFALVGRVSDAFRPGDRVVLMGLPTEATACDHEPTLEVRILYRGGSR